MEWLSGNGGGVPKPKWLTTDWILTLFAKRKKIEMARYRQFILEGVQHQLEIWSNLKGQIYLVDPEKGVQKWQKKSSRNRVQYFLRISELGEPNLANQ
jgi:putative transposase